MRVDVALLPAALIPATLSVATVLVIEEIARVVHFLAADSAGYITGQVWGVNGGLDM